MAKKLLTIVCFLAPVLYGNDLFSSFVKNAYYGGAISTFGQVGFGDDPSLLDISVSLGYKSERLEGYEVGLGAILTGKIYESMPLGFEETKQIFIFNSAYLDYEDDNLKVTAGRFKGYDDFLNFYNQGLSISYTPSYSLAGIEALFKFNAIYGSAIVSNEFITPYKTDILNINTLGAAYNFSPTFKIPLIHATFNPYIYVTSMFSSLGLKTSLFEQVINTNIKVVTEVNIMGYFKYYPLNIDHTLDHKFVLTLQNASNTSSVVSLVKQKLEVPLPSHIGHGDVQAEIGVVGVSSGGAELINYLGQGTPFKYEVGMYDSSAFSMYAFMQIRYYDFYIKGGARKTYMFSGDVSSFELTFGYHALKWLKIGGGLVGVYNNSNAINPYGGNNYTIVRGYASYLF